MTVAVYAGSFDPLTLGHTNLILRASKAFDKLIVGVGVNSSKKYLFSQEERVRLLRTSVPDTVKVIPFEGLLVKFCKEVDATVIVRGLRAVTDFEQELGIAHANADQDPDIDTFFLPTQPTFSFVSSTVVREIAKHGGKVDHYVNSYVEKALLEKFGHG